MCFVIEIKKNEFEIAQILFWEIRFYCLTSKINTDYLKKQSREEVVP